MSEAENEREIMLPLVMVHTIYWDAKLGRRLQSFRKSAPNEAFWRRERLAEHLKQGGLSSSDSRLKRMEMGLVQTVEIDFLRAVLKAIGTNLADFMGTEDQSIQIKAPEK